MVLSNGFFYERIQLDTINERFNKVPTAKEGDANGRGMIVVLTENGLVKNTTGVSLLFKWEHTRIAGAQGLEDFEPLDLTKGEYIVTYPAEMNHEGYVKAEIRIIDNGKYAGSRNMKIQVEPSVGDDTAMESSNQFSALVTALLQVNSWNTTIDGKIVEWEADMAATKQLYIDNMEEVESTYPIELNSVKQQLEQKAKQLDFANAENTLNGFSFTKEDPYTAWPWSNVHYDSSTKKFIIIYNSKPDHAGAGGRILIRTYDVATKTFSASTLLASDVTYGCNCNASAILANGDYVALVKMTGTWVDDGVGVRVYRSTDHGVTWTYVTAKESGVNLAVPVLGNLIELSDGSLLSQCSDGFGVQFVLKSSDGGANWTKIIAPSPIGTGFTTPLEGSMVELNSGTIVMISRASMSANYGTVNYEKPEPALISKSYDKGLTWEPYIASDIITDMTCNPCAIIKKGNIIELNYGSRFKADGVNSSIYQCTTTQEAFENLDFGIVRKIGTGYGYVVGHSANFGYLGGDCDENGNRMVCYYDDDGLGVNLKYITGTLSEGQDYEKIVYNNSPEIKQIKLDINELKAKTSSNKIYLYDEGQEKYAITGGWADGFNQTLVESTLNRNVGNIEMTLTKVQTTEPTRRALIPDSGVDVTNLTKLYAIANVLSYTTLHGIGLLLYNKKNPTTTIDGRVGAVWINNTLGKGLLELDVSSFSGVMYPSIVANINYADTGDLHVKFYQIWGE